MSVAEAELLGVDPRQSIRTLVPPSTRQQSAISLDPGAGAASAQSPVTRSREAFRNTAGSLAVRKPLDRRSPWRSKRRRWAKARGPVRLTPVAPGTPVQPILRPAGNLSLGYRLTKRACDVAGACFFLLLFSPIMLITWMILMVTTKGRPIFAQERVGLCGRHFRMYKFRTMHLNADKMQHLVQNEKDGPVFKNKRDPRITRIGRFLRSTSIDEMPQLVNVLLGDMSLVGPRPPLPKEVAQYETWQHARLTVKPGLTCLWQVSGRCEIGFHDWVRMDIWYRQNQSLQTDVRLLIKTPISVLSRRGAY